MSPACPDAPDMRIKQEHVDDEWSMRHSPTAQEILFVPQAPARERAKDSQGRAFTTQCFESPYLGRPHFHRLKCGHDIATLEPDICGSNCQPAFQYTESDLKAVYKPFECPHPDCQAQALVAPRKTPKTGRRMLGRPCQLGHVRGRNREADAEWDEQKAKLAEMKSQSRRPAARLKELLRQTSRSPRRSQDASTKKRPRGRNSTIATVAEIDASMDDPTRTLLLAQKGRQTRHIRGDRLETETDRAFEYVERDIGMLGLENVTPTRRRARRAASRKSSAPIMDTSKYETRACDSCSECGAALTAELYRCHRCTEDGASFLLCRLCHEHSYDLHLRDHPSHHFVLQDIRAGEWAAVGEVMEEFEMHCTCHSTDLQYMIQCDLCSKSFHPGCVGKGLQDEAQYSLPKRDEYFKADLEHFRQNQTENFTCRFCDALERFQNGIVMQRREAKRHEDFLLQYKPKLASQRGLAMKRAESDDQRAVVDSYFAAIEEEMDEGKVLTDHHWRGLLAKSQLVPLPPPKPQKRNAMQVDEEEVAGRKGAQNSPDPKDDGPVKRIKINGPGQTYKHGGQMTLALGNSRGN
ncbi:hypothetical protein CERZMDRAFT_84029 [Cercospora zeae-maydis SCOH1-5]|uniref:Zinc finger PHD-type domain-containing protein n=1 Tax=Cercospora zeae-maydis SCOH1-5 TaxID=717836 RepID=A0A6A6FI86_9PEZI|nr:hypothetical protein CERZMDRAFT_84029 [Cercospora zeae-maydis SCOH1-5]